MLSLVADTADHVLVQAGTETPVDGNQSGSYLTMKSNQGMVFGAATILSGFAGVFCDQGGSRPFARPVESSAYTYIQGTGSA